MKKLILIDHTGVKLLEQDLFLEGQNFEWQANSPTAFWLGRILVTDEPYEPQTEEEIKEVQVKQATDEARELTFEEGVEQAIAEDTLLGTYKEVKQNEPTSVDNQGTGDSRASENSEPKSLENLPKQHTRRKTAEGNKHT